GVHWAGRPGFGEVLEVGALGRRQNQEWTLRVGARPERPRTAARYKTVPDEPFGVGLRLVPDVLGVERQREGEVADLDRLGGLVLNRDAPLQRLLPQRKRFGDVAVPLRLDLPSLVGVDAPLEDSRGRPRLQLRLQAQRRGGHGI